MEKHYATPLIIALAFSFSTSTHAAGAMWSAPVVAPVPFDDSGVPAPLQTLPMFQPGPNEAPDTFQFKRLATTPWGYTLVSYSALVSGADGQPHVNYGLQLRSPDGAALAGYFENYAGAVTGSSASTPKGHDASYIAMTSDLSTIWVAIRDDNGERLACRLAHFSGSLNKRFEIPCSSTNSEQQIHSIVPLSNKLAAVQYAGVMQNALVSSSGSVTPFNKPVGKILTHLRLLNGQTALLTTPTLNPGSNTRADIQVVNQQGNVVKTMPVSDGSGAPLQGARFELRQLNSRTLLIVSRSEYGDVIPNGDKTPHTRFTGFDLNTGTTKWSKTLDAAVDFDVRWGKIIAVGGNENDPNQDPYAKMSSIYEFSFDGDLNTTPVSQPLDSYLGVLYHTKNSFIAGSDVLSALTINPDNTLTLSYTDYYPALVPPHKAIDVKIDRKTGAVISKSESLATFYNIQRDSFNNLYRIKTSVPLFGFDNSFNLSQPATIDIEKYNPR